MVPYSTAGKVLGFNLSSYGMRKHINAIINRAKAQLNKLTRFEILDTKFKLQLYITLVRSILEYHVVPLCAANITRMRDFSEGAERWIEIYDRGAMVSLSHLREPGFSVRRSANQLLQAHAQKVW